MKKDIKEVIKSFHQDFNKAKKEMYLDNYLVDRKELKGNK